MSVIQVREEEAEPQFAVIPADKAFEMWPYINEHFDRALEHAYDNLPAEHVLARVLTGELYLMVVTRDADIVASFTFERVQNRAGATLHCMTLAGEDVDWWVDPFIATWKKLAREMGCNRISIKGRRGWERYAREKGFKHMYTIMHQELEK